MKRKNIIFYFTDQQRYDTVNRDITPNIMELAEKGVKYENNYTCQPVCGPARACLQTGVYATQCGCFKNGISLPENITPLAEYFNSAGYETAYIGKWHLASDMYHHYEKTAVPKSRQGGYSYWRAADILEFTSHGYDGYVFDGDGNKIEFKGYRADCINDFALEFLDKRDSSKPFFMFISQLEPHHQNDRRRFEGYRETVEKFKGYPKPEDLSFLKGDYDKHYADYLSAINRIDRNVGKLCKKLKDLGIFDDTVIIFTSDHGCHFKTRNLEYKRCCHDSASHTPLVICGGDFSGGKIVTALTSLIDIPPTLCSIAGIDIPDSFEGHDLKKQLEGDNERSHVYMQISESHCGRAIRTKNFKYSIKGLFAPGFVSSQAVVYVEDYLYDLSKDPYEKHNLVCDKTYKATRSALREIITKQMLETGEKKPVILPALISKNK